MRRLSLAVLATATALTTLTALPGFAQAPTLTPEEALERLFTVDTIDPAWFADAFLAQVSVDQVAGIIASIEANAGPMAGATGSGTNFTVRFDRAEMAAQIALDAAGRISGLFFGPPVPTDLTIDELVTQIAALPGDISVMVTTNGELAAGHRPEATLAVGSAFKLAVLHALWEEIAAGTISLDDVTTLRPEARSLPTGILQDWPAGTPVTVATLANLMISISDNTATDNLILFLGRDRVEEEAPGNVPFLSTTELFKLKSAGHEDRLAAWVAGDEAARRAIQAQLADSRLPTVDEFGTGPIELRAEWHFNAFELCAYLEDMAADMPALHINPGLAEPANWATIAFKGGSEPGALNLSTYVIAGDGTTHCVVATWNHTAPLDDLALYGPYTAILAALAEVANMPP